MFEKVVNYRIQCRFVINLQLSYANDIKHQIDGFSPIGKNEPPFNGL